MSRICGIHMKNNFKKVTHVIFDMDGILLDTETLYTQVTQNVLDPYGKTYTPEVKSQVMGLHGTEVAKVLVEIYDLPITPEEYIKLALEQMLQMMPNAKLLPDSESIYKSVITNIAKKYGQTYTGEIMTKLLGTTQKDSCRIAVREMNLPISPEHFNNEFNRQSKLQLKTVGFLPGVKKFVTHLKNNKVPIAVATSSSLESYELKAQNHGEFFNLFDHKVFGGSDPEVKKGKPSPDIFLVCASRFPDKPNPEQCLVLEDSPNGVTAAIKAGMQCVMIPDKEVIKPENTTHATLVLDSMSDLQPEAFGLPPYNL